MDIHGGSQRGKEWAEDNYLATLALAATAGLDDPRKEMTPPLDRPENVGFRSNAPAGPSYELKGYPVQNPLAGFDKAYLETILSYLSTA